jgi:hypothetical protein
MGISAAAERNDKVGCPFIIRENGTNINGGHRNDSKQTEDYLVKDAFDFEHGRFDEV